MTTRSWFAAMMLAVAPAAAFAQAVPEQVRVPERQDYTNAHMGPTSTQPVIVLVPAGTALPVIKKQGEWYLVKLAPELRKLGMRMRWYKNETQGWVHESTVEIVPTKAQPAKKASPAGSFPLRRIALVLPTPLLAQRRH